MVQSHSAEHSVKYTIPLQLVIFLDVTSQFPQVVPHIGRSSTLGPGAILNQDIGPAKQRSWVISFFHLFLMWPFLVLLAVQLCKGPSRSLHMTYMLLVRGVLFPYPELPDYTHSWYKKGITRGGVTLKGHYSCQHVSFWTLAKKIRSGPYTGLCCVIEQCKY